MATASVHDQFLRESQYFDGFDTASTPVQAIERMRAWLARAPTLATVETMNIWGLVLHRFVCTSSHCPDEPKKDAALLGSYLDAMAELNADDWWAERDNGIRAYDAFKSLCGVLGPNHVLMDNLLDGPWNVNKILTTLHAMREREMNNMGVDAIDWDLYVGSSTQGFVLNCLWARLAASAVALDDTDILGQIWLVERSQLTIGNSQKIESLRQSMPSQMPKMLTAVLFSSNLNMDDIAALFPLRQEEIDACDAHALVHALVGLLTDGGSDDPTYKAKIVGILLREHHPQLASLMELHLSLVPQACESCTYADMVVPGFEALRGRAPRIQESMAVSELFAGDPAV